MALYAEVEEGTVLSLSVHDDICLVYRIVLIKTYPLKTAGIFLQTENIVLFKTENFIANGKFADGKFQLLKTDGKFINGKFRWRKIHAENLQLFKTENFIDGILFDGKYHVVQNGKF